MNGTLSFLSETAAKRGFSGSAQTDQSDATTARGVIRAAEFFEKQPVGVIELRRRKFFEESGGLLKRWRSGRAFGGESFKRRCEREGNLAKFDDGDIGATEFDLGQEAHGERRFLGELAQGESVTGTSGTNFFAELLKIVVCGHECLDRRMPATSGAFASFSF